MGGQGTGRVQQAEVTCVQACAVVGQGLSQPWRERHVHPPAPRLRTRYRCDGLFHLTGIVPVSSVVLGEREELRRRRVAQVGGQELPGVTTVLLVGRLCIKAWVSS